MKKYFLLVLSLVFAFALVSAQSFTVSPASITFSQSVNGNLITLNPTITASNFTFSNSASINIKDEKGNLVSFNPVSLSNVMTNVTITQPDYSNLYIGKVYTGQMAVTANGNSSDTQNVTINLQKSFCKSGDVAENLSIDSFDVNNKDGDDFDWVPLNNITVEVQVSNTNDDTSAKISTNVKLGLYDSSGREKLSLDEVKLGSIEGGHDKTAKFSFQVPADMNDGTYKLVAKAYKNSAEASICTSQVNSNSVSVSREDNENKLVIFSDITVSPDMTVSCGNQVTVDARIFNIGDSDQDRVKSKLVNTELGVNLFQVTSGLNMGDDSAVQFTFKVPDTAAAKTYFLELRNLYNFNDNYNEQDDAAYDQYSDPTNLALAVTCGAQQTPTSNVQVTATLESAANAGQDATVKATVTNTGSSSQSFSVLTSGTESFASSSTLDSPTFTLGAGESKDVTITLKLNPTASGDYSFNIQTLYNGNVKNTAVSIPITAASSSLSGLGTSIKSNWLIWLIVLINVVLIIAIIIVAVRVLRK